MTQTPRGVATPLPTCTIFPRFQHWRIDYPVEKTALLERAQAEKREPTLLEVLRQLGDERYHSSIQVLQEIQNMALGD